MIPLPIIKEPFQRIAMDIVGPLPRSRQGHRYIIVICDYATRYPEAFPLKAIDAPHVAEELMKFSPGLVCLKKFLQIKAPILCQIAY